MRIKKYTHRFTLLSLLLLCVSPCFHLLSFSLFLNLLQLSFFSGNPFVIYLAIPWILKACGSNLPYKTYCMVLSLVFFFFLTFEKLIDFKYLSLQYEVLGSWDSLKGSIKKYHRLDSLTKIIFFTIMGARSPYQIVIRVGV